MLKDDLDNIKQTKFMLNNIEDFIFKYYERKITNKLIAFRKRGKESFNINIPYIVYSRLEKYFDSEGIWVIYLHGNNKMCRVRVCKAITKETLGKIKRIRHKED